MSKFFHTSILTHKSLTLNLLELHQKTIEKFDAKGMFESFVSLNYFEYLLLLVVWGSLRVSIRASTNS